MRTKTFFIIPGFGQKPTDKAFTWLGNLLKKKGFKVVKVSIEWRRRTMADYVKDFIRIYDQKRSAENYVLGFSYGAVVAFLTAATLKPDKIYLCSLSPDFKEDLHVMKPWIKKLIGKRRIKCSQATNGKEIAKKLKTPSVVFYGQLEAKKFPQLKIRCEETAKLARNSKLVIVKDAPHDIAYPAYKEAVMLELFK